MINKRKIAVFALIYEIDYFIVLKRQEPVNEKLFFPHGQHSGVTTKTCLLYTSPSPRD